MADGQDRPVVNTFSPSDIQVELTETEEPYKMIPGYTIHKDPAAKILAGSEDCYLFVELEKSANFDDYMEFTMAEGWQELSSVPGVYYREVSSADSDSPSRFWPMTPLPSGEPSPKQ